MSHANVTNLDPKRIKEFENRKRKKKIFEFAMTLSESEIQLAKKILSMESDIELIKFSVALSEREIQFVQKLLSIVCRRPAKREDPCEVIQFAKLVERKKSGLS